MTLALGGDNMEQNILESIKNMLGINDDQFDIELIIYINSAFSSLCQLGAGPKDGFALSSDGSEDWSNFSSIQNLISLCKLYIYLKIRLTWDIPSSATVIGSLKEQLAEIEWRIVELVEGRSSGTSGGTGDGTDDYELLNNLPKLDGKTIIGNMKEQDPSTKEVMGLSKLELIQRLNESGGDSDAS